MLEPWTTLSGSSQWTCLLAGHSQSCWEKSDCLPACHGVRRIESFIISVSQPRHGEGPHSLTDGQLGGSTVGPEQKKCGGQDEDKGVLSLKS